MLKQNIRLGDSAIVIPIVIFEESVHNMKNIQHFNALYANFYRLLSQLIPIYITDTPASFASFKVAYKDEATAIQHYVEIAKLSTENIEIMKQLRAAICIADVDTSLRTVLKDCGERFVFLYSHAFIAEGRERVRFHSNEIQGVYRYWAGNLTGKSNLHRLLLVKDAKHYKAKLKVITLNKLFYETLVFAQNTPVRKAYLLQAWRFGKYAHDPVGFIEGEEMNYQAIDNDRFLELVEDEICKIYHQVC